MTTTPKTGHWLGLIMIFGLVPLLALGLWLGQAAASRAWAVSAGPVQANLVYSAASLPIPAPGSSDPGVDLIDPSTKPATPDYRVQAWGPLRSAHTIAVLIPGVGHGPAEFDSEAAVPIDGSAPTTLPERARALLAAAADPNLAVVAWLGYQPPAGLPQALLDTDQAQIRIGAANLLALNSYLAELNPAAAVTWICHSYGSLICASALHPSSQTPSLAHEPAAVVLLGSPGVQTNKAADLPTSAQIWAGRGPEDFIQLVPLLNLVGGGFGPDPAAPSFGALPIACEPDSGHSDYFRPGSIQLRTLVRVVKGATND